MLEESGVLAHFSSLNESARLGEIVEAVKALELAVKKDIKEDLPCKLATRSIKV